MKRFFLLLAALLVAATAMALEVKETIWGYDGQAVAGRFNPLSILMANPTDQPFNGSIVLYKMMVGGSRAGAEMVVEAVSIGPMGTRWVQFFPFVNEGAEEWALRWGRGAKERADISAPKLGLAARVVFSDPENAFRRGSAMKSFADNLFPTSVIATDALDSVVLDYAPKWEQPKREAFLDWLRRGGTLHLIKGTSGDYPKFTAPLTMLNDPSERFRVGAGLVVRHPILRQEMSEEFLESRGFPSLLQNSSPEKEKKAGPVNAAVYPQYWGIYNWNDNLLKKITSLTKPKHNWALIYVLNVLYLVLVGPLNYHFSKKWRDYRLTIGFFLGSVLCFGLLFSLVGRRAYGETTAVHSLAYARSLGGDEYDVCQWSDLFVTRGADYTLTHQGTHHLYSTCVDMETVNGKIYNGKDGKFVVDIPIYSSRAFVHRGKMQGPLLDVRVESWEKMSFTVGRDCPRETLGIWVVVGEDIYTATLAEGRIRVLTKTKETLNDFLSLQNLTVGENYYGYWNDENAGQQLTKDETFLKMTRLLMARALGGLDKTMLDPSVAARVAQETTERSSRYRVTSDRIHLFLFTRGPKSFELQTKGVGKEIGYVLYHVDLFPPQTSEATQ